MIYIAPSFGNNQGVCCLILLIAVEGFMVWLVFGIICSHTLISFDGIVKNVLIAVDAAEHVYLCVCVCVRACVRACPCVRPCVATLDGMSDGWHRSTEAPRSGSVGSSISGTESSATPHHCTLWPATQLMTRQQLITYLEHWPLIVCIALSWFAALAAHWVVMERSWVWVSPLTAEYGLGQAASSDSLGAN